MSALVELYSRPGCHLCEIAKSEILKVKMEIPFGLVEIDISSDPSLEEKYGESVPVILVNGEYFARFELDTNQFKTRIISFN